MTIGDMIRAKGLYEVSSKLGVKPQRVCNWIARNSYPAKFLKPLSQILEISLDEMLDKIFKN